MSDLEKLDAAIKDLEKLKKIPSLFHEDIPNQCKTWFDRHIYTTTDALQSARKWQLLNQAAKSIYESGNIPAAEFLQRIINEIEEQGEWYD